MLLSALGWMACQQKILTVVAVVGNRQFSHVIPANGMCSLLFVSWVIRLGSSRCGSRFISNTRWMVKKSIGVVFAKTGRQIGNGGWWKEKEDE